MPVWLEDMKEGRKRQACLKTNGKLSSLRGIVGTFGVYYEENGEPLRVSEQRRAMI